MKSIFTLLLVFACYTMALAQPNLNVSLVGQLDYPQTANDIWGYVAPDGTEYALVCLQNGVSIVSLADPANPTQVQFVPGANSGWRDVKTWDNFAYVTNETNGGLAVIDLNHLPDSINAYNWQPNIPGVGTINTCHNIFIDEFGYAYLSGCNVNNGGVLFLDVFTTPGTPVYEGKGPTVNSHDVYARDSIMYSADISNGYFSIHDVRDKANSQLIATQNTPALAAHNVWLNDEGSVLFTTDEVGDAPVAAYDIRDPNDIIELDQFRPFFNLNMGAIPHNAFVWDDYLIVSYYSEGCIVLDGSRPENLVQVGNFDTFLGNGFGFNGAWGAYPFLPSGLILVSDQSDGLFVLEPNYIRACFLEGNVTDASTETGLFGAKVEFVNELPFANSDLSGAYSTGFATAGSYAIKVSKPGYMPVDTSVAINNGEVTTLDVALEPLPSFSLSGQITDIDSGAPIAGAQVVFEAEDITFDTQSDANGNFVINNVFLADYTILAGKWGYKTVSLGTEELSENNNSFDIELETGIEDIFLLDLGWDVFGSAQQGQFELARPPIGIATPLPNGTEIVVQVGEDAAGDLGNGCYITGNTSDLQGGILIGGSTRLFSPFFDLTNMQEPWVAYETWFLNVAQNGQGLGNDVLSIKVTNGDSTVLIENKNFDFLSPQGWQQSSFNLLDFIEPSATMRVIFEILDNDFNDVSEAAVDYFRIFDNMSTSAGEVAPEAFELLAYPNPSNSSFNIKYDIVDWENNASLVIYNILGQVESVIDLDQSNGMIEIGAALKAGVYLVQIQTANKVSESLKLVKNRKM